MDVNSAVQLLDKTFHNSFDLNNFEEFLVELFNTPVMEFKDNTAFIKKGYKKYVNKLLSLGSYRDDFGDVIGFYVVELSKESLRDRARTMQRNLIAQIMQNPPYRGAALVAFHEETDDDWRFSYVKRGFEFRNGKLHEKLSSPRRHSFLVGPNEPNHTCSSQFKELLTLESNITLDQIEDAFSIENVTDEFFNKYKNLFLDLNESLEEVKENDSVVSEEFDKCNIKSSDFAKKLMGQLVFIYFLQKKGWLGVKKDEDWGTGPKDFLRRLFNKEYLNYNNFFNDIIEPLFYKGFCEPVNDYHYPKFGFKVPFLNGGLFEPMNNYDWVGTEVTLKDDIFKKILDTFDKFNFTIKEDEPLEKEVAVDPEMLGKVFENLLENVDRRDKGAFYTPRSIVHFMCQQSLISYLCTNSDIPKEDLKEFIENGDLALESIIRNHEEKDKYNPSKVSLPDSIYQNSLILNDLLKNVKIIDPAVGSGAFPVGMMNEIVKARQILFLLNDISEINMYDLKKETIENSLYCVDLESSATDITKLRFWLSLVVDEDNLKNIRALPNLDNHIVCGNSLVDEFEEVKLFYEDVNSVSSQTTLAKKGSVIEFQNLEDKKQEFFNEKSPMDKLRLKNEIEDIKWNFITESLKETGNIDKISKVLNFRNIPSKPFFIWELEFSEIFKGENPGFDIAIGNPPYVKENTNKNAFDGTRNSPYYQGKMDLWYLFGCKALDLVKDNGSVSFIATNNWITSFGASKFRNKVNDEAKFEFFIDFGNYKAFTTASIQTMIYLMKKNNEEDNYYFDYSKVLVDNISQENLRTFLYSNETFGWFDKFEANFNRNLNKDSYFNFIKKEISEILDKLIFDDYVVYLQNSEVSTGIDVHQDFLNKKGSEKLGLPKGSGIFVISDEEKYNLNLNRKELNLIKPYYTPEELKRFYAVSENNLWVIYTKSDINEQIKNYPNIKKHFDKFKEVITSDNKPYGLHRARNEEIFTKEKIIVTRKCIVPTFSYANFDAYVSQTFMVINSERFNLKYLTGLLNSKLIQFWLKYKGKMQGNNYQLDKEPLLKIPIILDKNELIEKEIANYVNKILSLENKESEDIEIIENKINQLVYELYGLNEDDIKIIEENI